MTAALLAALRSQVELTGSQFVVFYVPSNAAVYREDWNRIRWSYAMAETDWSPSADADRLSEICDRLALDCILELNTFIERADELQATDARLYYEKDGHWTPAGHQLAAEVIADHLASQS